MTIATTLEAEPGRADARAGFDARTGSGAGTAVRLSPERLRPLTRLSPWRAGASIAAAWGWIAAAAAAIAVDAWWATALAVIVIGSRQHALGIMAHDGAHYLIARDKRWNDALTQLLLAWPVGMSLHDYRRIHGAHHRHLNTERDPDWVRNDPDRLRTYRGPLELLQILGGIGGRQRDLLQFFGAGTGSAAPDDVRARRLRAAFYLAVIALFAGTGRLEWLGLYWLLPLFAWFVPTMRLKGIAEHFAVENREAADTSRTVLPTWIERLLVAPANVHFHIEHHLYPSVPFYRLPALHAALMEAPAFRGRAHLTHGYAAFLRECIRANRRDLAAS